MSDEKPTLDISELEQKLSLPSGSITAQMRGDAKMKLPITVRYESDIAATLADSLPFGGTLPSESPGFAVAEAVFQLTLPYTPLWRRVLHEYSNPWLSPPPEEGGITSAHMAFLAKQLYDAQAPLETVVAQLTEEATKRGILQQFWGFSQHGKILSLLRVKTHEDVLSCLCTDDKILMRMVTPSIKAETT